MQPLDPDDLATAAFDDDIRLDLDPGSNATLRAYRRAVSIGRSASADDRPGEDAPDSVWEAIVAGLGDSADVVHHGGDRPGATPVVPAALPMPDAPDPVPSAGSAPGVGRVISIDSRRRMVRVVLGAAAAAAIAIGGVVAANRDDGNPGQEVAAPPKQARLAVVEGATGVPDGTGRGTARLIRSGGTVELVVDTAEMKPLDPSSVYELWLLNNDGTPVTPKSLGTMSTPNATATVAVPDDIDTTRFTIVDISVQDATAAEPHQHSGHSLLRGQLL